MEIYSEKRKISLQALRSEPKSVEKTSFECVACKTKFTRKDALVRHLRKHCKFNANRESNADEVERVSYECDTCQLKYLDKRRLTNHIFRKHSANSIEKTFFECDMCKSKFTRKDALVRHIRTRCKKTKESDTGERPKKEYDGSKLERTYYECDSCKMRYSARKRLTNHILRKHSSGSLPTSFKCDACDSKFTRKDALIRHLRKTCKKSKEGKFVCLICGTTFISRIVLNDHYEASHAVPLRYIDMEFPSFDEFEKWIHDIERENIFRFVISTSKKGKSHTLKLYSCHRSGMYVDTCANKRRKRFLKNCGSKKLQGVCPARVSVKIESSSGTCKVQYQETHVGHSVKNEKELCHIYLNKNEKLELAKRISEGIPITHLKQQIYLSDAAMEDGNRMGTVNLKDLHNIASKYGIQRDHHAQFSNDELNIETFTEELEEFVLYYKRQDEPDTEYSMLSEDDFAIVLMDKCQESSIRLFSKKLVCFDGTHGANLSNFILHTMLIVDDSGEGKPVAFLISNRNDKNVIDFFLTIIRDRVGVIETRSFMTDTRAAYYESWIDVMGNTPEYHLYCTWHVREEWRKNFTKISNLDTREYIENALNKLSRELDPIVFEEKLAAFLQTLDDDAHASAFARYFNDNYVDNTYRWAYCYRRDSGINTSMHIEVFHRKLKLSMAHRKKIKTLDECLHYLRNYLTVLKNEDRVKRIRVQSMNKLQILRNRHHRVLDHLQNKNSVLVDIVDETTFVVESFEESDDNITNMYTVTRNDAKECAQFGTECLLFCNMCGICLHEYSCNCLDSTIRNNMCQHIHAVGIFIQDSLCDESKNTFVVQNEDSDIVIEEADFEDLEDAEIKIEVEEIE